MHTDETMFLVWQNIWQNDSVDKFFDCEEIKPTH